MQTPVNYIDVYMQAAAQRFITAPSNAPVPTGITVTTNSNGSIDITLTWTYTQGLYKADKVGILWNSIPTAGVPSVPAIGVDNYVILEPTILRYTFQNVNPTNSYRAAIVAGMTVGDNYLTGTIVAPISSPNWVVTATSSNNTNNIGGVPAANIVLAQVNFNARNDRLAASISSPGSVSLSHVVKTVGVIDLTVTWTWGGANADIDGFVIWVKTQTTNNGYTLGQTTDITYIVKADQRSFTGLGIAGDLWYTVGIQAFRVVDPDVNASGYIVSTLVQASNYQPTSIPNITSNYNGYIPSDITSGIEYLTSFEASDVSKWILTTGSPTVTTVLDSTALMGGKVFRITSFAGFYHDNLIPFDPNTTYEVKIRLRRNSGAGAASFGVRGIAYDGITLVGRDGSTSGTIFWAAMELQNPGTGTFVDYVGYIKGREGPGVTIPNTQGTLAAPLNLHNSVRYMKPYLIVNYNDSSVTDIDFLYIKNLSTNTVGAPSGTIVGNSTADTVVAQANTGYNFVGTNTNDASVIGLNNCFNIWTGTYPTGWSTYAGAAPTKETTIKRVGDYSVKYTAAGTELGMRSWQFFNNLSATSVISGTVDIYLGSRTSGLPGVLFALYDVNIVQIAYFLVQPPATTTGIWYRVPFTLKGNGSTVIASVDAYILGSSYLFPSGQFTGTCYFDNFQFSIQQGTVFDNAQQLTSQLNGTIASVQIANAAVTAAKTAIAAIDASSGNLVANSVTSANIVAGTIVGSDIAAGTITASNLNVSTLSAITANLGTVTAGSITGTSGIDITGAARFNGSASIGGALTCVAVNDGGAYYRGIYSFGTAEGVRAETYSGTSVNAYATSGTAVSGTATTGFAGVFTATSSGKGIQVSSSSGVALDIYGPMHIDNSTLVTNLNADKLDGYDSTYFADGNGHTIRFPGIGGDATLTATGKIIMVIDGVNYYLLARST